MFNILKLTSWYGSNLIEDFGRREVLDILIKIIRCLGYVCNTMYLSVRHVLRITLHAHCVNYRLSITNKKAFVLAKLYIYV